MRRDPATGEVTVIATTADGFSHDPRGRASLPPAVARSPARSASTPSARVGKRGEVIIDSHLRTTNPRDLGRG
ncbi:MAG: hypothetical protein KIT69_04405 [Propionibacteriaceae bacterium]|nr:hypothetical protein [Propionibacteriaceae bacterium]